MQIKNRVFTILLSLCLIFTLCTPLLAEEPTIEVDFKMAEKPMYIYEMTSTEIINFFKTAKGSEILDPSQTTMEFGMMVIGDDYQLRDITVLSFKITDIKSIITNDEEKELEKLEEMLFNSVKDSLSKRSISPNIYAYDCDIKTEKINGKTENAYFHMALYLGDKMTSFTSDVIANFIIPKINDWKSLTTAEQLLMLNSYILNGQFKFDTELKERKSVVSFIKDGKGTSEDYAGLVGLFLDEMGLENIIVKGTLKNSSGKKTDHSWNMVKIDGKWYHLDIFANGPLDETGKHIGVYESYILKATSAISHTHTTDKAYEEYANAAKENYNLSPEEENFNPSRPGLSDLDSEMNYLLDLLNTGYDILENHAAEYSSESIKNLTSIYTDCRDIYLKENVTVNEIRSAQKMLDTVLSSLTKASAVNKEALFYNLGKAYEMLYYPTVSILYPAEELLALEEIYNNAALVYQNENATQNQVDSANWTLRSKVAEIKALLEPEEPVQPVDPEKPEDPESPEEPDNPEAPVEPVDPEQPSDPDIPTNPDPIDPDNPDEPSEPIIPDTPVPPVDPSQPDDPADPNVPADPEDPADENKIPTDILIYGLLAIVAAGGIIFLIIDGILKRKSNKKNETIKQHSSEDKEKLSTNIDTAPAEKTLDETEFENKKEDTEPSPIEDATENSTETVPMIVEEAVEVQSIEDPTETSKETELDDKNEAKPSPVETPEREDIEVIAVERVCPIITNSDDSIENFKISAVIPEEIQNNIDVEDIKISQDDTMIKAYNNIIANEKTAKNNTVSSIEEPHKKTNLKTEKETPEMEPKSEEQKTESQLKEEITENQKTVTEILKQIKKEKEIKNHEKK